MIINEIDGFNVFEPGALNALAEQFRAILDPIWLDAQLNHPSDGDSPIMREIRLWFTALPEWIRSIQKGLPPADHHELLRFAMCAAVAAVGANLQNGSSFVKRLQAAVRAGRREQFHDVLFEAEAARYCLDRLRAPSVEFGPPVGHPDLWVSLDFEPPILRIPAECKRIQPSSVDEDNLQTFAEELETGLRLSMERTGPLAVILWAHRDVTLDDAPVVSSIIQRLCEHGQPEPDRWITASDPQGYFQVSLRGLGRAAEFQDPGPVIEDVPARPVLITRGELKRIDETRVESRLKCVLSVRSDVLPDRIGRLRKNLRKAIDQLKRADTNYGIVFVRIRPPRGYGDLFEADGIVRSELQQSSANHVALVTLFWNESDEEKRVIGEDEPRPMVEHTVKFALKPYFIANPHCGVRFDILDSRATFFPNPPLALLRDPRTGELTPADPADVAAAASSVLLPPPLRAAHERLGSVNEEEDAVTFYIGFDQVLGDLKADILLGAVYAGARHFRSFLTNDLELRVIEMSATEIIRVATVDLRAWKDTDELAWVVTWNRHAFDLMVIPTHGEDRMRIKATAVRTVTRRHEERFSGRRPSYGA